MTYEEFHSLLRNIIESSDTFYLIVEEIITPDPEWYGIEFNKGERFMFYRFKGKTYKGEMFLNDSYVDEAPIPESLYYNLYNVMINLKPKGDSGDKTN